MKNFTKTFKIGEVSFFGKIRVTVFANGNTVIEGMNWDTNIIQVQETFTKYDYMNGKVHDYLEEASTSYWADKMIKVTDKFYSQLKIKFNDL